MTYLSDDYRVKGYLGLPNGLKLPQSVLGEFIADFYETPTLQLPIAEISCALPSSERKFKIGKASRLPAMIYCRGGIGKVGRVKTHWVEQFANHGYLVMAPSYRGNEGGEGRDEFGGRENEDVLSAYRFLRSLPFVDPERISIMGFSRGAINAAQTAVEELGIHSLILWGGVSDLSQTYEERIDLRRMLKRLLGVTPAKAPEQYHSRSPLFLAERIRCPVLLMHGTKDVQVDFSHGQNMYEALQALGADAIMHRYEGYGHHFASPVHEAVVERMFDWIKEK